MIRRKPEQRFELCVSNLAGRHNSNLGHFLLVLIILYYPYTIVLNKHYDNSYRIVKNWWYKIHKINKHVVLIQYKMQIGSYDAPEIRLVPETLEILKKIQESYQDDSIQSKDLAILLGYKYGTESQFYRKIRSLQQYGLLEGKGTFRITELGKSILIPIDDDEQKELRTKAILNVPIWNELYKKYGKSIENENFWVKLMNVTGVERDVAKNAAGKILKWYLEDSGQISEEHVHSKSRSDEKSKTLRSSNAPNNTLSQQMENPKLSNSDNIEVLSFDKYQIALPKGDLKKEWEKLKKYMDIKLEDYKYEEPKEKQVTLKDIGIETQDAIEENNPQED